MHYVFDTSFVSALIIPDEKNPLVDKMYSGIEVDEKLRAAAKKRGVAVLK